MKNNDSLNAHVDSYIDGWKKGYIEIAKSYDKDNKIDYELLTEAIDNSVKFIRKDIEQFYLKYGMDMYYYRCEALDMIGDKIFMEHIANTLI